jgi:hypothetical protein
MYKTHKMTQSQKRNSQSARSLFTHDILDQFSKKGWKTIITHKGRIVLAN